MADNPEFGAAPAIIASGGSVRFEDKMRFQPPLYEQNYNYEQYVPTSHFRPDALIVPTSQVNRVRQFQAWRQLYNGEYWHYGYNPVKLNYHEITANFLAELLLNYPPEFEGADELPPRFVKSLLEQLFPLIVDMVVYGTGVLHILPTDYGPLAVSRDPTYWYPASTEVDTLLIRRDGYTDLFMHTDTGVVVHEVYLAEREQSNKLGKLLKLDMEVYGTPADWEILRESFTGRVSNLLNATRRPDTGDWGRSLFPMITNLALEWARGTTDNRDTLIEHLKPLLLFLPGDKAVGSGYRDEDGRDELKNEDRRVFLERLRKNPSMELPDGIIDAKYLTWPPNMEASFAHTENIEQSLFLATNVSGELYGKKQAQGTDMSGVAWDRQYLRSAVHTRGFQSRLIDTLTKALGVAALTHGITGSRLQSFIDNVEITWPNPFDRIEEEDEVQGDVEGAETVKEDGNGE